MNEGAGGATMLPTTPNSSQNPPTSSSTPNAAAHAALQSLSTQIQQSIQSSTPVSASPHRIRQLPLSSIPSSSALPSTLSGLPQTSSASALSGMSPSGLNGVQTPTRPILGFRPSAPGLLSSLSPSARLMPLTSPLSNRTLIAHGQAVDSPAKEHHAPLTPSSSILRTSEWGTPGEDRRGKKRPISAQDRQSKGLSLFSRMVCDKVEKKRKTSYTEVSDELVKDFAEQSEAEGGKPIDEKNIRRRVYDALNVLIALDIIEKDRKKVVWRGLPGKNVDELDSLQRKKAELEASIVQKREQLADLVSSEISYRALMNRNEHAKEGEYLKSQFKVHMPFIIVNTEAKTKIFCEMKSDKEKIFFQFDRPFEIHEDVEILRWLNLDLTDLNLDPRLLPYVPASVHRGSRLVSATSPNPLPTASPVPTAVPQEPASPIPGPTSSSYSSQLHSRSPHPPPAPTLYLPNPVPDPETNGTPAPH